MLLYNQADRPEGAAYKFFCLKILESQRNTTEPEKEPNRPKIN